MTDITEHDPVRVTKLMEGIGRCIFIYQRIEILLKLLLPHIADPTNNTEHQSSSNWRSLLDTKQTLGPLIKQFSEKMNSGNPKGFSEYLKKLVDQRNELVHHFFNIPSEKIRTNIDVENRIDDLRSRMQFAIPFLRALEDATQQFAAALEISILEDKQ